MRRIRLFTRWCASDDGILLDRKAAGTSPVKLILVQCHAEATRDSKGETVGAGRRLVAEPRAGGRLALFATGGRVVERERLFEARLLVDARADVDRDDVDRDEPEREAVDRDDDGVPCERVPRCELSEPLMAYPPLRISFDQIHQEVIQYEQLRQNQPCPLLQQLQLQRLLVFPQCEFQDLERGP